jgi:hypothetical protein
LCIEGAFGILEKRNKADEVALYLMNNEVASLMNNEK